MYMYMYMYIYMYIYMRAYIIYNPAYTRSQMEAAEAGTSAAQFMETAVKYGSLAVAATSLLGSAGVNIGGLAF